LMNGVQHRLSRHRGGVGLSVIAVMALCLAPVLSLAPVLNSSAQTATPTGAADVAYTTSLEQLGPDQDLAALYQPVTADPNESIGLILTHEYSDFIGSTPCLQLAQRGFTVLCVKSQYDQQSQVVWDDLALDDVSPGVSFLRGLPTVKKVVLVGYSGGGAIMSYYQNIAENGIAACDSAVRLDPCTSALADMPPADGVVILDGVPGIAFDRLIDLDASIVDENNLNIRDPALDMFDPGNGYNATGSSDYSRAFIDRYTRAQGAREASLIAEAERLEAQIANGTGQYTDNAPMAVGRDCAEIAEADLNVLYHTQGQYPVISPQYPNGGPPQTVYSIRPVTASKSTDLTWSSCGADYTAETYLSVAVIKAPDLHISADSITGVDWQSTNTATVDNVAGITTPLLIMGMTASQDIDPVQQEMYYQAAVNTTNKTLVYVLGATHGLTACTDCAEPASQFGDTVTETFNYMGNWLSTNFGS
jgi:pimeloyl-ACP methyl ester carboxylesterase